MTDVMARPASGDAIELEDFIVAKFEEGEEDGWESDGEGDEEWGDDEDDWDEDEDWDEDDDWDEEDDWDGEDDDWSEGDDDA